MLGLLLKDFAILRPKFFYMSRKLVKNKSILPILVNPLLFFFFSVKEIGFKTDKYKYICPSKLWVKKKKKKKDYFRIVF